MTKIILHGILAKEFGKFFHFHIAKPKDAIRAIDANKRNFEKRIKDLSLEGIQYTMVVDGKKVSQMSELDIKKQYDTVEFVPLILGSGPVAAVAITLVGVALVLTKVALLVKIGIAIAMLGVSMLIQLAMAEDAEAPEQASATTNAMKESFRFSNKANLVSQGSPVPFGYGRLRVGSQTVQYSVKSYPQSESSLVTMTSDQAQIFYTENDLASNRANAISSLTTKV
jgi:predicted phage tail protein